MIKRGILGGGSTCVAWRSVTLLSLAFCKFIFYSYID